MFFSRRRGRDSDPYLDWKIRLFFLGASLATVGIGMEASWLVSLAILVLIAGASLRFLPGAGKGDPAKGQDQTWDGSDEEETG